MKPHIKKVRGVWMVIGAGITCRSVRLRNAWQGWREELSTAPYTPDMAGSGQWGICEQCGLPPTPEGHDGCLGTLPESTVMNACCGHGRDSAAYVQFWGGDCIRGDEALAAISDMTDRDSREGA